MSNRNSSMLCGAEIIVRELIRRKVKTVFGYPGASVLPLYDELYKHSDKISHVLTAHEQGAAHAADGFSRASGKTGVVIATSGPGATNLVTGIATAFLDSVPLVVITGNVASHLLGKDSFQEVDIFGITMPVVKHSFIVQRVEELSETIRLAFKIAEEGRKGPVLIDIPKNIQTDFCEYCELIPEPMTTENISQDIDSKDMSKIIQLIKDSKRPYIYSGGGVVAAECGDLVLRLSELIQAPIGMSMMGLTAIPHSYPLNLGMTGMHGRFASTKAMSEADLIIAIGVRFSDRATGKTSTFADNKKIIHIDIDPAEINKNIKSDIGLCGDLKSILQSILRSVNKISNETWLENIRNLLAQEAELKLFIKDFCPKTIIETVNSHCDSNTVIATDVGQHQMWVMQYYKFFKTRTLLTSGGLGTMGYGLGAAIGGAMATGAKTVLFTGDGSFGMNCNELATVVRHQLPITIVMLNNGVLGMVRQWQTMFYDQRYSTTTHNRRTDYVALAKAFGAEAYRATNIEELERALISSENFPVFIECLIDKDERVLPMIPAGAGAEDMIIK